MVFQMLVFCMFVIIIKKYDWFLCGDEEMLVWKATLFVSIGNNGPHKRLLLRQQSSKLFDILYNVQPHCRNHFK